MNSEARNSSVSSIILSFFFVAMLLLVSVIRLRASETISLAGEWRFEIAGTNDSACARELTGKIHLPGTMDDAGLGPKNTKSPTLEGPYAMSLAPVTWVVSSRKFSKTGIRGAAMSVATSALWIAYFILTFTFPILNAKLGSSGTFWLYGVICVLGLVFIFFKLPETKNKSLEQIERDLSTKDSATKFVNADQF